MSHAYSTEPPTKGKVLLRTTSGDLEIELWTKEAPRACRNFVQLCLEGYYDNTIFHRIVRNFIVQGGDPTGTGFGGESIYGAPFPDEFHSRLRFNHRGLLAMASTGPNTNKSQFFFTLDKTEHLDRQNTIFGKLVGNTIFNLLRMGELETDKEDRPFYPPKILSTSVLSNPFDDIVPRSIREDALVAQREREAAAEREKPTVAKKSKNLSLLSFGEDAEEPQAPVKQKIKSIHDVVVDDPRLSRQVAVDLESEKPLQTKKDNQDNTSPVSAYRNFSKQKEEESDSESDDEPEPTHAPAISTQSQIDQLRNEIRSLSKSNSKHSKTTESKSKPQSKSKASVDDLRNAYLASGRAVSGLGLKKKSGKLASQRDSDTLAKLQDFQQMLKQAPSSTQKSKSASSSAHAIDPDEQECDLHFIKGCESCRDTFTDDAAKDAKDDNQGDLSWMASTFKFTKKVAANVYEPKVDDYAVIDPRQELKSSSSRKGRDNHKRRHDDDDRGKGVRRHGNVSPDKRSRHRD